MKTFLFVLFTILCLLSSFTDTFSLEDLQESEDGENAPLSIEEMLGYDLEKEILKPPSLDEELKTEESSSFQDPSSHADFSEENLPQLEETKNKDDNEVLLELDERNDVVISPFETEAISSSSSSAATNSIFPIDSDIQTMSENEVISSIKELLAELKMRDDSPPPSPPSSSPPSPPPSSSPPSPSKSSSSSSNSLEKKPSEKASPELEVLFSNVESMLTPSQMELLKSISSLQEELAESANAAIVGVEEEEEEEEDGEVEENSSSDVGEEMETIVDEEMTSTPPSSSQEQQKKSDDKTTSRKKSEQLVVEESDITGQAALIALLEDDAGTPSSSSSIDQNLPSNSNDDSLEALIRNIEESTLESGNNADFQNNINNKADSHFSFQNRDHNNQETIPEAFSETLHHHNKENSFHENHVDISDSLKIWGIEIDPSILGFDDESSSIEPPPHHSSSASPIENEQEAENDFSQKEQQIEQKQEEKTVEEELSESILRHPDLLGELQQTLNLKRDTGSKDAALAAITRAFSLVSNKPASSDQTSTLPPSSPPPSSSTSSSKDVVQLAEKLDLEEEALLMKRNTQTNNKKRTQEEEEEEERKLQQDREDLKELTEKLGGLNSKLNQRIAINADIAKQMEDLLASMGG